MSMSTDVVGLRPADETWDKMKEIWDACTASNVEIPLQVRKFFNDESPEDKPGMEIPLKGAVTKWRGECQDGLEVDLTKLPPDVKILRFFNSY